MGLHVISKRSYEVHRTKDRVTGNSVKSIPGRGAVFITDNSTVVVAQIGGTAKLPCVVRKFSNGVVNGLGYTDIFAHVMPFSFYDTLHTCGPDPYICCQFDFQRLLTSDDDCPSNVLPRNITDQNVAERAQLLLDQYRKKSMLFRTNTLLVTLGDDFRFNTAAEWDLQYENYQKLFDYLNTNKQLNTQVKFGTLSDYFMELKNNKFDTYFPTLSGDFFSYADRDDHFWTGTYTSKQYFKRIDRILLSYIRAVDVALMKTGIEKRKSGIKLYLLEINNVISDAKKVLALFQHHDGLSGTAYNQVIYDYGKKMLAAIEKCQHVLQELAQTLLHVKASYTPDKIIYYKIDDLINFNNIGKHYTIEIDEQSTRRVVIFNPLTFARSEVVTFMVTFSFIEVLNFNYKRVECQISPVLDHENSATHNAKYYVSFVAHVPAFGMSTYFLNGLPRSAVPKETTFSTVLYYNYNEIISKPDGLITYENLTTVEEFMLKNDRISASFGKSGLLKAIHLGSQVVPVELEFTRYHNRISSGHLFLPENSAVSLKPSKVKLVIIQGLILSSVTTQLPHVLHSATLYNSSGVDGLGIEIQNIVNITDKTNFELMMRLTTNMKTEGEFFSDSNGYQLLKRKYLSKLPIQGNFYPMPTMSYIEDRNFRLSLLTDTPVGVASLHEGQIEVTLDQRNKPCNKSCIFGDKTPVMHKFRLLLEMKNHSCKVVPRDYRAGIHTTATYLNQQALLNPLIRLISTTYNASGLATLFGTFDEEIPIEYSIILLRNGIQINKNDYTGLILHRQYVDKCHSDGGSSDESLVNIGNFFNLTSKFFEASLSFTTIGKELMVHEDISLCPMDIQAYVLQLT